MSIFTGRKLDVPTGRQWNENTLGDVDDGLEATGDRVAAAREHSRERNADEFEPVRRREWREIATDTAYRQIHGSPLYGPHGLDESAVDSWFVLGGRFVFLVRADRVEGTSVKMGTVFGRPGDLSERATGLGLPLGRPS